ncbi:MAG TPA: Eco57I restriction-modification methylase domain-containing protein [Holophagaceae bacterium]|nr:Eco57I restriction-modification methylase domain-containing protein [Holophagaceae bacterium]
MTPDFQVLDAMRREATERLDQSRRGELGQFLTPSPIARFMADMFTINQPVRLLDAGAGIGSLTGAFVARARAAGVSVHAEAWEIDPLLRTYLGSSFQSWAEDGTVPGFTFLGEVHPGDFIEDGAINLLMRRGTRFTHAILNPPYKKLNGASHRRNLLSKAGIEAVNLYAAFLGLAIELTEPGGEIVAIIPRSFCNGAYYRPFRALMLDRCAIRRIHLFKARDKAFVEDGVLQENLILHLSRGGTQGTVDVTTSTDASFVDLALSSRIFEEIVQPGDHELFIRIPVDGVESQLPSGGGRSLSDIGLEVCTGPVVDFRVRAHWLMEMESGAAPLVYARHFLGGRCVHPQTGTKKPEALTRGPEVDKWLMPKGHYVVVKRLSSKEERKRLVASVVCPDDLEGPAWGFENHLNVFHRQRGGMDGDIAWGLAAFLNSTLADRQFRVFSGHTQVNATDLRSMNYPGIGLLRSIGQEAAHMEWEQENIDALIERMGVGHEGRAKAHQGSHRDLERFGLAKRTAERKDGHLPLGFA